MRGRSALIRYLSPEYRVADLHKLIFSDLYFGKLRNVGTLTMAEFDHWRMEMRHIRAAENALAETGLIQGEDAGVASGPT